MHSRRSERWGVVSNMNYSKKQIEKKFNCILDKNMAFDSGTKFWTAHKNNNGELGNYLAETYTLKEMYETLNTLTKM